MQTDSEIFPFSEEHIQFFKKELEEAGNFTNLMIQKEALDDDGDENKIYENIKEYKKRFLKGVYKSLRPMYDTELPYIFWNAIYEIIARRERYKTQ